MMRWPIIALTLIFAMSRAAAQDMPLSQILIDGEGWKPAPRDSAVFPPREPKMPEYVKGATCRVMSPDGGTMFVGSSSDKYVWAFRIGKNSAEEAGQPYCSLRVPRGQKKMPVTGLCVDTEGRIYAATPIGVQIFDPTGRLCGVLTKPSSDPVKQVNLINDMLYVATDRETFMRKVKAHGVAR